MAESKLIKYYIIILRSIYLDRYKPGKWDGETDREKDREIK